MCPCWTRDLGRRRDRKYGMKALIIFPTSKFDACCYQILIRVLPCLTSTPRTYIGPGKGGSREPRRQDGLHRVSTATPSGARNAFKQSSPNTQERRIRLVCLLSGIRRERLLQRSPVSLYTACAWLAPARGFPSHAPRERRHYDLVAVGSEKRLVILPCDCQCLRRA